MGLVCLVPLQIFTLYEVFNPALDEGVIWLESLHQRYHLDLQLVYAKLLAALHDTNNSRIDSIGPVLCNSLLLDELLQDRHGESYSGELVRVLHVDFVLAAVQYNEPCPRLHHALEVLLGSLLVEAHVLAYLVQRQFFVVVEQVEDAELIR